MNEEKRLFFTDPSVESEQKESDLHRARVAACQETISRLVLAIPDVPDSLVSWKKRIDALLVAGDISKEQSEKAVQQTVILLDVLLVNEISSSYTDEEEADFRDSYYRDTRETTNAQMGLGLEKAENISWMKHEELDAIISYLNRHYKEMKPQRGAMGHFLKADSVSDVKASVQHAMDIGMDANIFVSKPLTLQEVRTLDTFLSSVSKDTYFSVYVPVSIDNKVGGIITLCESSQFAFLGYPLSSLSRLPRQDVWLAMLKQGIPLFSNLNKRDKAEGEGQKDDLVDSHEKEHGIQFEDMLKSIEDISPEKVILLRKIYALLLKRNEADLAQLKEKHTAYYQRKFGREHPIFGESEVLLTRSGNSANEVAINTAVSLLEAQNQEVKTFTQSGFYYENLPTIKERCKAVDHVHDANVLLVAHQAIVPNGEYGPSDYPQKVEELIQSLVLTAEMNPDQDYFVIYDKTQDPGAASFKDDQELPSNVTFFETTSLSKFQRGGVNYFYGMVQHWTKDDAAFTAAFEEQRLLCRSGLTDMGIVSFPHITKNEVDRTIERQKATREKVQAYIEERNKRMPDEMKLYLDFTNFSFFILNAEQHKLLTLARNNKERNLSLKEMIAITGDISTGEVDFWYNVMEKKSRQFESIVPGDSFGMHETRFSRFNSVVDIAGSQSYQRFLRISPGSKTSDEDLLSFIKQVFP